MRLLLDPEGRMVTLSQSTKTVDSDEKTTERNEDMSSISVQQASSSWERMMTRLCQRVRDVEILIHEDLRDIEEPLGTLGSGEETLTTEQVNQWKAAKEAYSQLHLECSRALARILLPFDQYLEKREHESGDTGCESSLVEPPENVTFPGRCLASG